MARTRVRPRLAGAGDLPQTGEGGPSPLTGSTGIINGAILGSHFNHVRNVLQIPFDDSVDGTHSLECFFQMPTDTLLVKSAKVWVQRKSFRSYSTATVSGGGGTSGTGGLPSHTVLSGGGQGSHFVIGEHPHSTDAHGTHGHSTDAHPNHDHSTPNHTHGLSFGIFEQAASGTLSLSVANDGVNYGGTVVSGVTSIDAQALTGLTESSGDKRIKIEGTGLMRVQILVMLDLIIKVPTLT